MIWGLHHFPRHGWLSHLWEYQWYRTILEFWRELCHYQGNIFIWEVSAYTWFHSEQLITKTVWLQRKGRQQLGTNLPTSLGVIGTYHFYSSQWAAGEVGSFQIWKHPQETRCCAGIRTPAAKSTMLFAVRVPTSAQHLSSCRQPPQLKSDQEMITSALNTVWKWTAGVRNCHWLICPDLQSDINNTM